MTKLAKADSTYLLEMLNISKSFPGVCALNKVNFQVKSGEVHVLVGENGAGKSTLMKILSGALLHDEGEIYLDGKLVKISNAIDAQKMGICMIYQELNLVPTISVAENIFLGRFPVKGIWGHLDWRSLYGNATEILERLKVSISPKMQVFSLSVAKKQMVEIAKALSTNARIIIMDEPTSSLTLAETSTLFELIDNLKKDGVSIIFITHRLEEVFAIADRITVFRDGHHISTSDVKDVDQPSIVSMMVGRELDILFPKIDSKIGKVILQVRNLNKRGLLYDINLNVREGEIVGVAGLVGAGRSDLAKVIFGILSMDSGEVVIEGNRCQINSPRDAIKFGLGLVPEDRKEEALILARPISDNITISIISLLSWVGLAIRHKEEDAIVNKYIKNLGIKTPSSRQLVSNLSGGNQQKVVIARWLAANPKVLIIDEPTRGIDVGAKAEIHALLGRLAQRGVGILMISSELSEILGVSDRIIVMHEGRITGEFSREEATQELIIQAATKEIIKQ
jgi:ABC-type sugar transport system ATPase subunit